MLWSRYRKFTEIDLAPNPLLAPISQPGVGPLLAPASPLGIDGSSDVRAAPTLGADTVPVPAGLLGLAEADVRALAERGIVGIGS